MPRLFAGALNKERTFLVDAVGVVLQGGLLIVEIVAPEEILGRIRPESPCDESSDIGIALPERVSELAPTYRSVMVYPSFIP